MRWWYLCCSMWIFDNVRTSSPLSPQMRKALLGDNSRAWSTQSRESCPREKHFNQTLRMLLESISSCEAIFADACVVRDRVSDDCFFPFLKMRRIPVSFPSPLTIPTHRDCTKARNKRQMPNKRSEKTGGEDTMALDSTPESLVRDKRTKWTSPRPSVDCIFLINN